MNKLKVKRKNFADRASCPTAKIPATKYQLPNTNSQQRQPTAKSYRPTTAT